MRDDRSRRAAARVHGPIAGRPLRPPTVAEHECDMSIVTGPFVSCRSRHGFRTMNPTSPCHARPSSRYNNPRGFPDLVERFSGLLNNFVAALRLEAMWMGFGRHRAIVP